MCLVKTFKFEDTKQTASKLVKNEDSLESLLVSSLKNSEIL